MNYEKIYLEENREEKLGQALRDELFFNGCLYIALSNWQCFCVLGSGNM